MQQPVDYLSVFRSHRLVEIVAILWVLGISLKCSSNPTAGSGVLDLVPEAEVVQGVESQVSEVPADPGSAGSPEYGRLIELLQGLGYEAVGFEYEKPEKLIWLFEFFSRPIASNRKIQRVYTGIENTYDAMAESVTIKIEKDPKALLKFFQKSVPSR